MHTFKNLYWLGCQRLNHVFKKVFISLVHFLKTYCEAIPNLCYFDCSNLDDRMWNEKVEIVNRVGIENNVDF